MICVFLSFLPGITQFFIVNTLLAEYSPVGKQGYKGSDCFLMMSSCCSYKFFLIIVKKLLFKFC